MKDIIYIKIGTEALLDSDKISKTDITGGIRTPDLQSFTNLEMLRRNYAEPITKLQNDYQIICRVSGSIGLAKLMRGITTPTDKLPKPVKVMLAGLGQNELINIYRKIFHLLMDVGQIQLTEYNRNDQHFLQSINALGMNEVIPLINENDVMDYTELDGNNDLPAARDVVMLTREKAKVKHFLMVGAEDGFYEGYGGDNPLLIKDVYLDKSLTPPGLTRTPGIVENLEALCNGTSKSGAGGWKEKLNAIKEANDAGIDVIAGSVMYNLMGHLDRSKNNTYFHANTPQTL